MTSWLGHGVFEIWASTWSGCGGTVTLPSMRIELPPPPPVLVPGQGEEQTALGSGSQGSQVSLARTAPAVSVWLALHPAEGPSLCISLLGL